MPDPDAVPRPPHHPHRRLQRGFGAGADTLLGSGLDNFLNQAAERNVLVHVMVYPKCGEVALINYPQRELRGRRSAPAVHRDTSGTGESEGQCRRP
ncbi:MAG: hypothetical protein M0T72_01990, partial [Candidatus Dormibacteraeota bacterium]|nr:hypothetical protein [Candidatus Dormibacteraeota bacterium]